MNTLITPAQAVALAFADGEYLAPESVTQSDIAAAEQRYLCLLYTSPSPRDTR